MSSFRDALTNLIKKQVASQPQNRLGTVSQVNSDGTVIVLVDGFGITAVAMNPVIMGQQVVTMPDGSGGFKAAPLLPTTPPVDFTPAPLFTGGPTWRFVVDESGFPDIQFRLQDNGSSSLYRLNDTDVVTDGLTPSSYKLSEKALFLSVASRTSPFSFNYTVKSYKIGSKLVSAGPIDPTNKIFQLKASTLFLKSVSAVNSILGPFVLDTDVSESPKDNGSLWYLQVRNGDYDGAKDTNPFFEDNQGTIYRTQFWFGAPAPVIITIHLTGSNTSPTGAWSVTDPLIDNVTGNPATYAHFSPSSGVGAFTSLDLTLVLDITGLVPGLYSVDPISWSNFVPLTSTLTDPNGNVVSFSGAISGVSVQVNRPAHRFLEVVNVGTNAVQSFEILRTITAGAVSWRYLPQTNPTRLMDGATSLIATRIANVNDPNFNTLELVRMGTIVYDDPTMSIFSLSGGQDLSLFITQTNKYAILNAAGFIQGLGPSHPVNKLVIYDRTLASLIPLTFTNNPAVDQPLYSVVKKDPKTGPKTGTTVDAKMIVRKETVSGSSITIAPLPGISNISPGQPDTTMVREITADGGLPQVQTLGLLTSG